ncbi:MAG: prolipoprotein diacylglyceryl transferase [Lachnospiraceae bacterium]|nr:prolipoprotein diacylglyceryl transferase [Lachnospiraceae bacterium]
MGAGDIAFPHLGIYLTDLPRGFQIGSLYIALYGVIIAIGMILGISLANHESNSIGDPKDFWWELALPLMFFSVLGARAYYVIFFWDYYSQNPAEILDIRGGGLAIYGGVIVGFTTIFIYSRIKKLGYFHILDTAIMGLLTGQIIGRWGNFTNREVFGGYTDNIFAMRLPLEAVRKRDVTQELLSHVTGDINYIQVHPTFLYEGALNAVLLLIIWCYRRHKKFEGELSLMYVGGYGIIRFFVEGIRTDQLKLWHTDIAVSQALGLILFIFSVICEIVVRIKLASKPQTEHENTPAEVKKEEVKQEKDQ